MKAAGGQEVSGARRWPFRPDMTDLQVNKHRGCGGRGGTMMTSSEMDLTLKVSLSVTIPAETINHATSHFFFLLQLCVVSV